jgi:hypothetical protein
LGKVIDLSYFVEIGSKNVRVEDKSFLLMEIIKSNYWDLSNGKEVDDGEKKKNTWEGKEIIDPNSKRYHG